jgi:putative membrane protein
MYSLTRVIGVLGATALVAACSKGDKTADSTAAADSTARANAAGAPATTQPAATTSAPLTDANIFALMDEANAADSTAGSVAATKGTAASVKAFARDMMRDHHKLRADGQALAKKLNITPAPPAGDSLPAMVQKESGDLSSAAKGADFDKKYIDDEVGAHQAVLATLQSAQGAAQDSSLKKAITQAIPLIQAHLTKAQDIQSKLGSGTPAAGDSTKGAAKKP